MGYYIGTDDIIGLLPGGATIGASTMPVNTGEVASVIGRYEADVDGFAAAAGYAVPISTAATYAFASMQGAARDGAAAFVLGIMFPTLGGPADKTSLASTYRQAYLDFRNSLAKGSLSLVGAGSAGESAGRALPGSGGLGSQSIDLCTQF